MKVFLPWMLACFAFCTATKFEDCGSPKVKVKSVKIQDCPEGEERCLLPKDKSITISIEFQSNSKAKQISVWLDGKVNGRAYVLDIPDRDGCEGHGMKCPLKEDETYTYFEDFQLQDDFRTSEDVAVEWAMYDEEYNLVMCINVPCRTED